MKIQKILLSLFVRHWLPYSVGVFGLLAAGIVSFFLWQQLQDRFPRLKPGMYHGAISGIFRDRQSPVRWYVQVPEGGNPVLMAVLRSGWDAQQVNLVGTGSSSPGDITDGWGYPPVLNSEQLSLKFTGTGNEPGRYSGRVSDLGRKLKGTWDLSSVDPGIFELSNDSAAEIRLWLLLRSELQQIDSQTARAESEVTRQKTEIEKLTRFVAEGDSLRLRADQKFNEAKSQLKEIRARLKQKQEEAKALGERIELSLQVTGMGKLVSLSRETLDREGRWFESMMNSASHKYDSTDVDGAFQRGEQIMVVKRAIALERQRIDRIRAASGQADGGRGL